MSQVYYISRDLKSQEGPFTLEELKGIVASGTFRREHLLWTSGMPDWAQAAQSTGLFAELPPPLPGSDPDAAPTVRQDVTGPGPNPPQPIPSEPVFATAMAAPTAMPRFAGFWRRVLAALLDGLLIVAAAGIVSIFATGGLVLIVVGWLYYSLMESSASQATLGKMAMGLRVTDMSNHRLDFGRATGRFFGKFVSLFLLCAGFIMAAFTQRKQGLHDLFAGTLVLRSQ